MKKNVHPNSSDLKVSCACGASFEVASTREQFTVDICSNCHPFFTGQQKFVDRAGRIEKFQRRFEAKK